MHPNSIKLMQNFRNKYLNVDASIAILDVGSADVDGKEGTYRPLFNLSPRWKYRGADVAPGPNVDVVVKPYCFGETLSTYDVVISGQCVEHVERPWDWMADLADCVREGGLVCVIAPWTWEFHEYPIDCWRILPDGMKALFAHAGLKTLEAFRDERDCVGIAQKPL